MSTFTPIVLGRVNVADFLTRHFKERPWQQAVIEPTGLDKSGAMTYKSMTYTQLYDKVNAYSWTFADKGIRPKDRVLVALKPGQELVAVTFSLFNIGAVPVFIDPGMGREGLLNCVRKAQAVALVGNFKAHVVSRLFQSDFRSVKLRFNTGKQTFGGLVSLAKSATRYDVYPTHETLDSDMAALLFTSGSTGPAKGVVYTHGIFAHQIQIIQEIYQVTEEDRDMSVFALFGLFAVSMGMTTVIPDMDTSSPAKADPVKILRVIRDHGITFSFGSPTFWNVMADYCIERNIKIPSLRAVLMAGCSVPAELHEKFLDQILSPGADIYVPYGATESLPLTTFTGSEVMQNSAQKTLQGFGTCVGKVTSDKLKLKIIKISDHKQEFWDESKVLPVGEVGEIVARGLTVTREYYCENEANAESKISEGRYVWHRLGDVGYIDEEGYLWFCGRKKERVKTENGELYTDQCENVFNQHAKVRRTALVGLPKAAGVAEPLLIVELHDPKILKNTSELDKIRQELLQFGAECEKTKTIQEVVFKESFPVDVRHNAKIKRDILTEWARNQFK